MCKIPKEFSSLGQYQYAKGFQRLWYTGVRLRCAGCLSLLAIFYILSIYTIYICYSPAGRSVLGETVPEVLSTASDGNQTEGTVSPNTDRPRPVNNIFIFFLLRFKSFREILLQPPTYVCWRRARSCWCYSKRAIDCKPKQNITTRFLICHLYYFNYALFRIKKGYCVLVDNS